jgi:hypothetical protein
MQEAAIQTVSMRKHAVTTARKQGNLDKEKLFGFFR